MQSQAATPEDYLNEMPEERRLTFEKLRNLFKENLPEGFEEIMNSGMINFVVPYSIYPQGYHCKPKQPLPFIGLAAQKHFIAVYHMGLYAFPDLLNWFVTEYPKHSAHKLDMGKSCIRFKKNDQIPYALLQELAQKITVTDWISVYEESRQNH